MRRASAFLLVPHAPTGSRNASPREACCERARVRSSDYPERRSTAETVGTPYSVTMVLRQSWLPTHGGATNPRRATSIASGTLS